VVPPQSGPETNNDGGATSISINQRRMRTCGGMGHLRLD